MNTFPVIVLDLETTGLAPKNGDRAIEIGAVRIEGNMIDEIKNTYGLNQVPFDLMRALSATARAKAPAYLAKIAGEQRWGKTADRPCLFQTRTKENHDFRDEQLPFGTRVHGAS